MRKRQPEHKECLREKDGLLNVPTYPSNTYTADRHTCVPSDTVNDRVELLLDRHFPFLHWHMCIRVPNGIQIGRKYIGLLPTTAEHVGVNMPVSSSGE